MVRPSLNAAHVARRSMSCTVFGAASRRQLLPTSIRPSSLLRPGSIGVGRFVSSTPCLQKGLSPESENPPPKQTEETPVIANAAEITDAQYHELADEYLEQVLTKFEELQDEREDVDVEFAAGVLTISFPSIGTYVINKQPPNKQIWLSSPKSGPKRYDWVIIGDGQDQKGGTGAGDWIYLRDMSSLNDIFLDEIGVDLSMPIPHYGE